MEKGEDLWSNTKGRKRTDIHKGKERTGGLAEI